MRERLQRPEATLRELQRFHQRYTLEDIERDPHLEWALRYGLLEAIQMVIDISCHLVSQNNLGVPATYSECIEQLYRAGYLNDESRMALLGMVGLRNILVHEYISVDRARLYALLERIGDFKRFVEQIQPLIR